MPTTTPRRAVRRGDRDLSAGDPAVRRQGRRVPPRRPPATAEEDSRLFVNVRHDCQRRIAALPPEARALYRARVDAQAERWFRQGPPTATGRCCVGSSTRRFASSWGDDALDLLGDLSFQDGQFAEALAAYRQLVPDRPGEGRGWSTPTRPWTSPGWPPRSSSAGRRSARTRRARPTSRRSPALSRGQGAVRRPDGPARRARQALARRPARPALASDGRWPTFAGAPTRTRVAPGPIDVGSFQWRVDLSRSALADHRGSAAGCAGMDMAPARDPARAAPGLPPDRGRGTR